MSERRSTQALFLVFLMLTSVLGQAAANETQNEVEDVVNEIGVVYGDLTNFNVETGSEYLLIEEDQPVVSATSFIKQAWIDEGRPGVNDIRYQPTMARSTCTQHVVGDTLTVPISGGSTNVYVANDGYCRLLGPIWTNPFIHCLAKSRFDMGPNHLSDHDYLFRQRLPRRSWTSTSGQRQQLPS